MEIIVGFESTLLTDVMFIFLFIIGLISILPFGFWVAIMGGSDLSEK